MAVSVTRQWKHELRNTAVCLIALGGAVAVRGTDESVSNTLFAASFAAGLWYPLREATEQLRRFSLNIDFLMLLVAGGAAGLGHPEEGAALLVLFGLSRAMESWAHNRTENAVRELMRDFPAEAILVDDEEARSIAIHEIVPHQRLMVRTHETFPVDCRVVEGTGTANVSAINGESDPLELTVGVDVPSGAVNGSGVVTVEVLRAAHDSAYQKIMQLVESAPDRKSDAQILSERVGKWFTWAILAVATGGFLVWWLVLDLAISESIYRAMALLVAGSPCALVLSIPSAVLAAVSSGARNGVLFNGGRGLSSAACIRTVIFDKTGTLSTGVPSVVRINGDRADDSDLPGLALTLANASSHPASRAVASWLKTRVDSVANVESVHEIPSQGVVSAWNGHKVMLGRDPSPSTDQPPGAVVALSVDGKTAIRFMLSETLRPHARRVIESLHKQGLNTLILSGDRSNAVERVANELSVDKAIGNLSPEEKYRFVVEARTLENGVMMVGDGINDVPAMAAADCSVAMGTRGTAAALEQADLVLARDRLDDLLGAMQLARNTRRVIRQNMTIAIGAAAVLVGFALAGSLPLVFGVFGHEGGTVLVVLNSLRLLLGKPRVLELSQRTPAAIPLDQQA